MAHDLVRKRVDSSDWSCGIGDGADDVGAIMFPKSAADKLDDVRYDLRKLTSTLGAGVFALAGAIATIGVAGIYHTAVKGTR